MIGTAETSLAFSYLNDIQAGKERPASHGPLSSHRTWEWLGGRWPPSEPPKRAQNSLSGDFSASRNVLRPRLPGLNGDGGTLPLVRSPRHQRLAVKRTLLTLARLPRIQARQKGSQGPHLFHAVLEQALAHLVGE